MTLNEIFNEKKTENGDIAFSKVCDNNMINILFLTEYYQKHLDKLPYFGDDERAHLFASFIRDPRYGLGKRDLGRTLLASVNASVDEIIKCGRVDDLFYIPTVDFYPMLDYLKKEIEAGNQLVKKWMPRYSSKNLMLARAIAEYWNMNKQQYGKFIKCDTTEQHLSRKETDKIIFEHVPSLAAIKYANRFARGADTVNRYAAYLSDVRANKKDLKVSTTNVYDIYRNRDKIDADLFFDKLEKISISCIPIVDTSASMLDDNDSFGKALAIGHYLAKCSTYCHNKIVSFSSHPQLITLGQDTVCDWGKPIALKNISSQYAKEIDSMYTGDCSNTDFGKVMDMLSKLDDNMPDYLIVLSDMEFDCGSSKSKRDTMKLFKEKGYHTRIVWWNLNSRNITCPEMDNDGNIFISGYNPLLLKFLNTGFDAHAFLNKLLDEYANIVKNK